MPAFVTCPACGVKVQSVEMLLGRRVRCQNCQHRFIAGADPAPEEQPAEPLKPSSPRTPASWPRPGSEEDCPALPLCPSCHHAVGWEVNRCWYCDEELEPATEAEGIGAAGLPARRDYESHRARLLGGLANLSLVLAGISMFCWGVTAILNLPLAITVWIMAENDLRLMQQGQMDPQGCKKTQNARASSLGALVVSLAVLGLVGLVWWASW